ncbi:MAG: DUF3098 domain-containing protein [Chitinophagaceae bacterium]|jgi:hypothetical protein|nr:DUF3098 domain-containing protein [Chitinophagaceae bacterium]
MATNKTTGNRAATPVPKKELAPLFDKENYMWFIIGAAVIALGMFLMSGGKNASPDVFDYNVVYSKMRITVAPIVILLGFGIEIYAILKRKKNG